MKKDDYGIIGGSELLISYGRHTPWSNINILRSYEDAMSQTKTGSHWSSTEVVTATLGTSTSTLVAPTAASIFTTLLGRP